MSGWTSAGPDSEDVADVAGEPGAAAAATNGAATTHAGGATKYEAEPPAVAADEIRNIWCEPFLCVYLKN